MKILHVIPSLGIEHGGPSRAIVTLSEHLAALGVDVTVATTAPSLPLDDREEFAAGTFATMAFEQTATTYYLSLPLWRWLARNVAQFDVVHVHEVFTFPSTAACRAAFKASVPYIITTHGVLMRWGLDNRRRRLKSISITTVETRMIKRAAAVHFGSERERRESQVNHPRQIVQPFGIERNAVDGKAVNDFRAQCRPSLEGRPYLIVLARLHPVKRIEIVIDALARLHEAGHAAGLVIAGDGDTSYVDGLKQLVHARDLDRDVVFTGFLETTERTAALVGSALLVNVSASESFGMAAVEAMILGVPVIVTEGYPLENEITTNGAGVSVPADASSLARAIQELLLDGEGRRAMGQRAALLATAQYSAGTASASFLELYESIAGMKA